MEFEKMGLKGGKKNLNWGGGSFFRNEGNGA